MKNILTNLLEGIRVVITGCGYKPVNHIFYDIVTGEQSHDSIFVNGQEMKLNIGSATAAVLVANGATVHMISSSEGKLKILKQNLQDIVENGNIEFSAVNLFDEQAVKGLVEKLPKDKPIYWVQSLGLGAGSYKVKYDNPYLSLEEIDLGLLKAELSLVPATHMMMQAFLPIFKKQNETRIAIISSMSAARGYSLGGTHCSAKGAMDRYANSAMLALYKNNIFVTTIRPGAVDTGMYDNPVVQEAVKIVSDEYAGLHRKQFVVMPPTSVAEAVNYVLTTPAHIPSLNLVAKGQWPNEAS
jgi:NADP-dependent 3-hydroxy acid dehydrogenase YdfG